MGMAKLSTPLIFKSKILCISLFYLFTTLFLSIYTSLSPSSHCLFRSSPFEPLQTPLFSYPSSYGEHKYAIPTHRSSCSSPVFFSDYWKVLEEIQIQFLDSSLDLGNLRYMKGKSESFGGNFTTQKRISYFDHSDDSLEIPCGFFKEFPISNSDKIAMEKCKGVVVVSALFNDHDKIRQPKSLGSKTLDYVCFFMFVDEITLKVLAKHKMLSRESSKEKFIGVWRIVEVSHNYLYENPAMNGVIPKYLVHRLFPNSRFSIWMDAKLQLMVDPLLLIHGLVVKENADMAISKHPFFIHTLEDAMATARWRKWWNLDGLRFQMETYCENGLRPWTPNKLPYPSDVPDSALILRRHGVSNNLFSCLLFNELEAFNPRDQLAFAYIRDHMNPKLKLNMFEVEVFEQVALEFRHNLKKEATATSPTNKNAKKGNSQTKKIKRVRDDSFVNSKCQNYLLQMWGESHN